MLLLEAEEVNGEPRPALVMMKAVMSKEWHTVVSAESASQAFQALSQATNGIKYHSLCLAKALPLTMCLVQTV